MEQSEVPSKKAGSSQLPETTLSFFRNFPLAASVNSACLSGSPVTAVNEVVFKETIHDKECSPVPASKKSLQKKEMEQKKAIVSFVLS